MLRLLRGKTEKPRPAYENPLDIKRYTRIEPRETRTSKPKSLQACEVSVEPKRTRPTSIPKAPAAAVRPKRIQKAEEINLSEHLYSDAKVSVALLRRALPMRFDAIDARKNEALKTISSPLKYAIG